jgi:hypothetical protein
VNRAVGAEEIGSSSEAFENQGMMMILDSTLLSGLDLLYEWAAGLVLCLRLNCIEASSRRPDRSSSSRRRKYDYM